MYPYRSRPFSSLLRGLLLCLALVTLAASPAQVQSHAAASASEPLVKVAWAQILADARGMTLYLYTPDKVNQSTCTGGCAKYWPPLLVPAGTVVPTTTVGIGGEFGVAKRADGTQQLTYDGAPLYTFIKDKKPGDMTGEGADGIWWVVGATAPTPTGSGQAGPLSLVKTVLTHMLVDGRGMTLYLYNPDKKNESTCTDTCAKYWPPLLVPSGTAMPAHMAGLSGTFGVAKRADGTQQLTYDGAPLYTFIKDKKPGNMAGEGADGIWWVVGTGAPPLVKTASAKILVDARGMTLYLFTPDKVNQSTCTGGCAK